MATETASQLYLGIVRKTYTDSTRGPFAQVEPLYQRAEDGKSWERVTNPVYLFPNRGWVTWFRPPATISVNSLWQFRLEAQPTFDFSISEHDKYKVDERVVPATSPKEVLDLSSFDETGARNALSTKGVFIGFDPAQQVYLRIGRELWIGPVPLDYSNGRIRYLNHNESLLPVVASIPKDLLNSLAIPDEASRRVFLAPSAKPPQQIGKVDWASDSEIIKRVLKALRKRNPTQTEKLGLTSKGIDLAVQELWLDDDPPTADPLLRYRVERARQVIKELGEREDLLAAFEEDLMALPSVQTVLKNYEELERAKLEEALRVEYYMLRDKKLTDLEADIASAKASGKLAIEEELQIEQQRLQKVSQHLLHAQEQLNELTFTNSLLEKEHAELEHKLNEQVNALDGALSERLQRLRKAPQDTLAELMIFQAALSQSSVLAQPTSSVSLSFTVPAGFGVKPPDGPQLVEFGTCRRAIKANMRQVGLPSRVVAQLHASLQSGTLPLLWGADSYAVLQAYADAVFGGCLRWIPVSANTIQWSDLFGSFDPAIRRFVPNSSGLADLIVAAQLAPDQMHIAILDGVNRSAAEMYLEPLLACYADVQHNTFGRYLSAVHPSCLDGSDPYRSLSWFTWPSNLLLAGILSDGLGLSLPHSVWRYATLIDLGMKINNKEDLKAAANAAASKSFVPTRVWEDWKAEASQIAGDIVDSLMNAITDTNVSLSMVERNVNKSFFGAVMMWLSTLDDPRSTSLTHTVISLLVPQTVSQMQADDTMKLLDVLDRYGIDAELVHAAVQSVQRISR